MEALTNMFQYCVLETNDFKYQEALTKNERL